MQLTRIITISLFGILLSACADQMQIEGSSGADALGKKHSHAVEGRTEPLIHQHSGDSSSTHTHKMSEIQ